MTAWDNAASFVPKVLFDGNGYTMWYSGWFGDDYGSTHVGRATSSDGRVWQKDPLNPVLRFGSQGEWDASYVDPAGVLFDGSTYHLWFTGGAGGGFPGTSAGIGYASSTDGVHWTKYAQNPVLTSGPAGSWDERGVGLGTVIYDEGWFHMWYAGNVVDFPGDMPGIGYAVSRDGIHWKKYPGNPVLIPGFAQTWDSHQIYYPTVIPDRSEFTMWYNGTQGIGFATSPRSTAMITFSDSSRDFQNVAPGTTSDTLHEVISNWGFTPLTISSIAHSREEFVFVDPPSLPWIIPPFSEGVLKIVFRPPSPGMEVGDTLVFASNDPTQATSTLMLRGRGSDAVQAPIPGRLYGITASQTGAKLFDLDRVAGTASFLSPLTPSPPRTISGFTVRPADHLMYAVSSSPTFTNLYRVSSSSGDIEKAITIPLGRVTAAAFGDVDMLYFADSTEKIYRIGGVSGDTVLVGNAGFVFTGLAFSTITHVMWASAHDSIFTVDLRTGLPAFVGAHAPGVSRSSLTIGPLGTLYALFDNLLCIVNKSSGVPSELGATGVFDPLSITMRTDIIGETDESALLPSVSQLFQNYPNPFNPATTIRYGLPRKSTVRLTVYNLLGQEVALLVNEEEEAGYHDVRFDGSALASGVYLYRMQAGTFVQSRNLLLLR